MSTPTPRGAPAGDRRELVPRDALPIVSQVDEQLSVEDVADLFHALGDPTRVRILNVLAAAALCVCDLVALLEVPQSTISRHIRILRQQKLVVATRRGKFTRYSLPSETTHNRLQRQVTRVFRLARSFGDQLRQERHVALQLSQSCEGD